jgi:hypothetical protein
LWYHFIYQGPLPLEEDIPVDDKIIEEESPSATAEIIEQRLPNLSSFSPVASKLFSNGRFFVNIECPSLLDEGMYVLEMKLGARDISGSEWEIPVDSGSRTTLPIRVSRSR